MNIVNVIIRHISGNKFNVKEFMIILLFLFKDHYNFSLFEHETKAR